MRQQNVVHPGRRSAKRGAGILPLTAVLALTCAVGVVPASAQHEPGGGRAGGFAGGDFHGRDFGHFGRGELNTWRGGGWRHEWHDGRYAWWWVASGFWYFYPAPIYPFPTYVPPAIVVQQAPPVPTGLPPAQFWYFCDNPQGYYPYVASCDVPWREMPATPPK